MMTCKINVSKINIYPKDFGQKKN